LRLLQLPAQHLLNVVLGRKKFPIGQKAQFLFRQGGQRRHRRLT
jgi:hypothetical protein